MLDPRVCSWRGRVLPGDPTNAGPCVLISCVSLQEFKGFGLKDGLMFIGGLAMTLFGVVLLSNRATEEMEYDPLTNEDEHDLWLQSRKALKHKHARKTDPYILPDNSLIDSD